MQIPEVVKPVVLPSTLEQVTSDELAKYAALIYERTGIRVSPQKKTLLSNRVRRRLRKTGIEGFDEYLNHLKKLRSSDPEWDAFLQEITTHETYLFRDEAQWDWFRKRFLSQSADEARAGRRERNLRIWSAACSTGDEVYTIATCIAACLPNHARWKIQIVGTDIGVGAIEQAKNAVFGERAMRLVPKEYYRYFTQAKDASIWQAKSVLTSMTSFRQHNLMDPIRERPFDLVFLKNVLIYFDAISKQKVIQHVRAAVRPGGLLVAGAAEGVADLVKDFRRIQPWLYQRPHSDRSR